MTGGWIIWGLVEETLENDAKIKRIYKSEDLIEHWISLINVIRCLIREVSKFMNHFGSKLQDIKFQGLKWIGIETLRGLINFIRGKFERIKSFKNQLRMKLKFFENNDHFINNIEIQGSNCIALGAKLKKKQKTFKDKDNFGLGYKT